MKRISRHLGCDKQPSDWSELKCQKMPSSHVEVCPVWFISSWPKVKQKSYRKFESTKSKLCFCTTILKSSPIVCNVVIIFVTLQMWRDLWGFRKVPSLLEYLRHSQVSISKCKSYQILTFSGLSANNWSNMVQFISIKDSKWCILKSRLGCCSWSANVKHQCKHGHQILNKIQIHWRNVRKKNTQGEKSKRTFWFQFRSFTT